MGSSFLNKLYDPIRKKEVAGKPEEQIRQKWVRKMVEELGYPSALIAVEKEVKALSLTHAPKFSRRIDILCFAKDLHPDHALYPLLLIECKKSKLTPRALSQVMGYNHAIGAYFFGLANETHIQIGFWDTAAEQCRFIDYLPSYQDLLVFTSESK